jgi:RNA polymerase sigma-70 factor (sigma-E family)
MTMQKSRERGDPDLVSVFAEHRLGLVRLAVLLVGDRSTAEDAVQDAFTRTYQNRDRLRDPGATLAYVRMAVLNAARSALRRRKVAAVVRLSYVGHAASAEAEVLVGEEARAVVQALRRLPRRPRETLVLRYYAGLSEAEIAATLGVTKGAVKSFAARGLRALAKDLEGLR